MHNLAQVWFMKEWIEPNLNLSAFHKSKGPEKKKTQPQILWGLIDFCDFSLGLLGKIDTLKELKHPHPIKIMCKIFRII